MDEFKNKLRDYIKANKQIQLSLGTLQIDSPNSDNWSGGNSLVYAGSLLDNSVAVKFFTSQEQKSNKRDRFKAEYLNVVLLEDTWGIVKLISYDELEIEGDKFPLIVMKRYDTSLNKYVKEIRDNDEKLLDCFYKIFDFFMRVLKNIHSVGIIHRDLKPENILVLKDAFFLTDFGIAYYDPELHSFKAQTGKDERLNNYDFSAPEQSKIPKPKATFNMDLYAMGQILQWVITGNTQKGTNRAKISSVYKELAIYDEIIETCLNQDPEERFQNIHEIENFIAHRRSKIRANNPIQIAHETVNKFREALKKSFSNTVTGWEQRNSYKSMNYDELVFSLNPDIDELLTNLSNEDWGGSLFFTDGDLEQLNVKLKKTDNGIWLIGASGEELMISSAVVYCDDSYRDREIIILRTEAMEAFSNYSPSSDITQEIALINGKTPISIAQTKTGYAKIGGKTIELKDKVIEYRSRHLKPQILLIATEFHRLYQPGTSQIIGSFVKEELKYKGFSGNLPYEYPQLRLESCMKLVEQLYEFKHRAFED